MIPLLIQMWEICIMRELIGVIDVLPLRRSSTIHSLSVQYSSTDPRGTQLPHSRMDTTAQNSSCKVDDTPGCFATRSCCHGDQKEPCVQYAPYPSVPAASPVMIR